MRRNGRACPRLVLALALALLMAVAAACARKAEEGARYHCPMHPTYISDRPGDCPICGMRLVPIETKSTPASAAHYVCPMHPEVVSDQPGRCSKCGMDLVPAKATEAQAGEPPTGEAETKERKILFYRSPMDPKVTSPVPAKDEMGMDFVPVYADEAAPQGEGVPGHAPVAADHEGLRLAGVQTAEAAIGPLARDVRTVGIVVADETRVRHVHTKIEGWIERLFLNFTGQAVAKGQPILQIYSPELLASQEEYLRAREAAREFSASALPDVRRGAEELVRAARERLRLFDVPEDFIGEIERTGRAQRAVTFLSPVSGFVTAKQTFEGQKVEPGMELFTVTDLSRVWVEADVYEYEAAAVRVGQKAVISEPSAPAGEVAGRVSYVYPYLEPESRTLKIRFDFDNADLALRPGMYVDVRLSVEAQEGVLVPDSAVMDTGLRRIVYVQAGEGRFAPREVAVGVRAGGKTQILSGVSAGERVVVQGNFLLDSESRLRAAIASAPSGHEGHY